MSSRYTTSGNTGFLTYFTLQGWWWEWQLVRDTLWSFMTEHRYCTQTGVSYTWLPAPVVKDISFTLFLFSPSFFLSILLPPFLPPTLSLTTQAFLPREEVYWLPRDKHEKDVQYLQHQEKTWVGQATVARRDTDGLYYPGRTSPVQPQQLKVYWSAYGSIVGLHMVVLSVCIR